MIVLPTVTLAAPADALAIAEMSRDTIEQGLGWSWTRMRVLGAIHENATNVVVVREQGALLGFGIMGYGEIKAHLSLLGVSAAWRQRGLGAHLLAWLEKSAIVAGMERIQLEARADNAAAIAFYAAQGYRETGTVTGYYARKVDAVRLEKLLRVVPVATDPGSSPG